MEQHQHPSLQSPLHSGFWSTPALLGMRHRSIKFISWLWCACDVAIPQARSPLQVHIKHVGTAGMLLNPTKLHGIAPKIQKLAVREHQISAHHEESLGRGGRPSMPPPGPGPIQPGALPNGTSSGTSSEEPSPAKRVPSMLPEIKEAPLVDIVPGVKVQFRDAVF